MSLTSRRYLWYVVWLALILCGPITLFRNTYLPDLSSNILVLVNFFQRFCGMLAYTLLFVQLMLGAFMSNWVQVLGARAYKIHITQGLYAYAFVLIHPLMQVYIDFFNRGTLGALFSLLPGLDMYLNLGKIALLFLSISVAAGYFRTRPFFRKNWRKLHVVNYLSFFIVGIHSLNLGTDVNSLPFSFIHRAALIIVFFTVVYKSYAILTGKMQIAKLNSK